MTSAVEKLDQVIALIDTPEKWCKGRYLDRGRRCILGAANEILASDRDCLSIGAALRQSIREAGHGGNISDFNDHPSTTHADVMRVLRRARGILQEQEQ